MANFAHILNGVVVNTIIVESQEIADELLGQGTCIEYTEENPAQIGFVFNGTTFEQPSRSE